MIAVVKEEDNPRVGYYAVIPATVLFNQKLKANAKLLYALITTLSNKEGYCFASNKYLGDKLGVNPHTISHLLSNLRELNFIYVDILRNEKQEIIQRKIYPNDTPYVLNNTYPYAQKCKQGMYQIGKENNINNNNINTHTVVKQKYSENVFLYDYEYKQLIHEYGEEKAEKCIAELSLYKKSKEIEYEDDYATIKRWVIIRVEELESRKNKSKDTKKSTVRNFEQRDYPKEFFDSFYNTPVVSSEDELEM